MQRFAVFVGLLALSVGCTEEPPAPTYGLFSYEVIFESKAQAGKLSREDVAGALQQAQIPDAKVDHFKQKDSEREAIIIAVKTALGVEEAKVKKVIEQLEGVKSVAPY